MSTGTGYLTAEDRKRLLEAVVETLHEDRDVHDPLHTFLPLRAHGDLLRDSTVLVEGERGAGKTAVFLFLSAVQRLGWPLEEVIPQAPVRLRWVSGFSEQKTQERDSPQAHPSVLVLTRWAAGRSHEELERFWLGHLCGRLVEEKLVPEPQLSFFPRWRDARSELADWVSPLSAEMGRFQSWLDQADRALARDHHMVIFGYDELDRLTTDVDIASARPLVGALVSVWIALVRRYHVLRARIFLRPDLCALIRTSTTDASKLEGHISRLSWTQEDAFRVLLRRLGANDALRTWLEEGDASIPFHLDRRLGWLPPYSLVTAERQAQFAFMPQAKDITANWATQEALGRKLAGSTMGSGTKKGYTHTWILNHSRDGLGRSLPRVTLNLIRFAAEGALERGPAGREDRLFHPSELEAAQERTGLRRLAELREHRPVVRRLEHLRDMTVPMDLAVALDALAQPSEEEDGHGDNGQQVLRSLLGMGLVTLREPPRSGGQLRLDVPDLFRKALGIRRRGGPLQIRSA